MTPLSTLIPWVAGRAELFAALRSDIARFDPRRHTDAAFIGRLRELDRVGWAEPLGRTRPSWVFYDCALLPGVLFGYARATPHGLDPVSLLALIPTIDGDHLVQSLAAHDVAEHGIAADDLAVTTLCEGVAHLGVERVVGVLPWASPFIARFLALGPLTLVTAWTPAHDLECSLTFVARHADTALDDARAELQVLAPNDHASQRRLQLELEIGAHIEIRAMSPDGPALSPWRRR